MSSAWWSASIFAIPASSCRASEPGRATAERSSQLRVEEVRHLAESLERRVQFIAPRFLVAIVREIDRQRAAEIDDADVRKRGQRGHVRQHRIKAIDQVTRD